MSDLDALLAGTVADPHRALRWLVMADWLEDHGFPERAELVRVHRELLRTCTDPDAHPERPELHARMMELMRAGVLPCLPEKMLVLPGSVELEMSFIPPGSFLMGSPETEEERGNDETLHFVTLTKGFWLGQTPVTQAQWGAVMGENPCEFRDDELPVETVSWEDAQAFCAAIRNRIGVESRLPTEAEWEYAARAGTRTTHYWGEGLNRTTDIGYFHVRPWPVGSRWWIYPHPWGLADVLEAVWEWCGDWYGSYPDCEVVDPTGAVSGTERVIRGGKMSNRRHCGAAERFWRLPEERSISVGFRIAADLE